MVEFKLVIADPKTGKCVQKTSAEQSAKNFIGLKIGDSVKGEILDLAGYEFVITGGSDFCGFPMRKGISGARKRVLITKGVGFRGGRRGMRKRKTVCGNEINDKITQINLKITKYGAKELEMPKKEGHEKINEKKTAETSEKENPKKEESKDKENKEKSSENPKEKNA